MFPIKTKATHCFIVEPLMNESVEEQAINRIHRIGQTLPTFVHRYIIEATIEERIMAVRSEQGRPGIENGFSKDGELLDWREMALLFD